MAQRLIGTGDPLSGLSVDIIDSGRRINQAGDFAFQAWLTDGVSFYEAIVRAKAPVAPPTALTAPSNLRATAVDSHQVLLEWIDNAAPLHNEDRIEVWLSRDGVNFSNCGTRVPDLPFYWDTSQLPNGFAGTSRFYHVRACNSSCSDFSNSATPLAPVPPQPRLSLTATAVPGTTSTVRLEWVNPAADADFVQIVRFGRYHDRAAAANGFHVDSRLTPGCGGRCFSPGPRR